jgi:hypothetical protein
MSTNIDKLSAALEEFMSENPDENGMRIVQPTVASNHFLDLVRGRLHYRAIYDPNFQISAEERAAHVKEAIDFFLNGALAR